VRHVPGFGRRLLVQAHAVVVTDHHAAVRAALRVVPAGHVFARRESAPVGLRAREDVVLVRLVAAALHLLALLRERILDLINNRTRERDRRRDLADLSRERALVLALVGDLACTRGFAYVLNLDCELQKKLHEFKEQLPNPESDLEIFKQWWEADGQTWTEQLRAVMIKYRNIGHNWQFSEAQKELLQQYHEANQLLVNCLNSACEVSDEVREEIEETLLLPIVEIEKRQQQM